MKQNIEDEKKARRNFRKAVSLIVEDTRPQRKAYGTKYALKIIHAACRQAVAKTDEREYAIVRQKDPALGVGYAIYAGWKYSDYAKSEFREYLKPQPIVDLRVQSSADAVEIFAIERNRTGKPISKGLIAEMNDEDGYVFDGFNLDNLFDVALSAIEDRKRKRKKGREDQGIEHRKKLRRGFHQTASVIADRMLPRRQDMFLNYAFRVIQSACEQAVKRTNHPENFVIDLYENDMVEDRAVYGIGAKVREVKAADGEGKPLGLGVDMRARPTLYGIEVFTAENLKNNQRLIASLAEISDYGAAVFSPLQISNVFSGAYCALHACSITSTPTLQKASGRKNDSGPSRARKGGGVIPPEGP